MLQLIKKDLLVSLKIKSLKNIIFTFAIGLVIMGTLSYVLPTIIPIIITYVVVMNSFYYDSLNKSESYILSLPNKREDIVYSKYILILLVLFLSNVLTYIIFGINFLALSRTMVLQDVVVSFYSIIFSFSIIIPLIFKFGYKVIRNIGPIIVFMIFYIIGFRYEHIILGNNLGENFLIDIFNKIVIFSIKHFNLITHDITNTTKQMYCIFLFLVIVLIFLSSIFISLKIYMKKDIE